jgi:iron(III) transport system substrate-binding protein
MAGMGEVDIAVAVQSETIRYRNEGFPISVIYPREGTAYMLTGAAVVKGSHQKEYAREFVDWLLQDDAQLVLQKNKFYFVPTNYATIAYKSYTGKDLRLFEQYSILNDEQKHAVLDRWVKEVRLQ